MGIAKRMLLLAEMIDAKEALATGFVARVAEAGAIGATAGEICARLASHAPLTMRAGKEQIRRVLRTR